MEIRIDLKAALLLIVFIVPTVILSAFGNDDSPIRGYEIVSDSTRNDNDDYQDLSVECPEGKVAIGGGAGIFWNEEDEDELLPTLVSSFMYPDNRGWYAEAVQPEDAENDWHLEVQVICAYVEED